MSDKTPKLDEQRSLGPPGIARQIGSSKPSARSGRDALIDALSAKLAALEAELAALRAERQRRHRERKKKAP